MDDTLAASTYSCEDDVILRGKPVFSNVKNSSFTVESKGGTIYIDSSIANIGSRSTATFVGDVVFRNAGINKQSTGTEFSFEDDVTFEGGTGIHLISGTGNKLSVKTFEFTGTFSKGVFETSTSKSTKDNRLHASKFWIHDVDAQSETVLE